MADPVQQNISQNTIPDYARPFVERMLGKTEGLTDINQNPYQSYAGQRIAGFTPMQTQAFQNVANQQVAGQIGEGSNLASQAGQGMLSTVNPAGQYGQLGSTYGSMAAGLAPQAQQYGAQGVGYGQQASMAGNQYNRMATDPRSMQAFMNPYIQSSLNPQLQMMDLQNAQTQQKNQAQAVGQGAFGGNRSAVLQGQTQFNNNLAKQNLIGQGYNTAFNQAQQAQQFGANLGLQGLQTGLQGQQIGLQGLQQAGNLYGQGMTGAQIGLQGVGAQQAGYAGANQAAQNLGQLGQTQFAQQQAITNDMQRAGAVQQAQQQQGLDVDYQNYLNQKNYPYQQLAFQSDMLRGLPLTQQSTSMYQAPPNLASQAGGLGMTALGVYGMSGGFKQNAQGGVIKAAQGGLMAAKAYKEGGQIGYASGGDISMLSTEQLMKLLDNPTLQPMERNMIEEQLMLRRRMEMNPESAKIMAQGDQRSGIGAISTGDMVPEDIPAGAGGGIVAFATGDVVNLQKSKSSATDTERDEERARQSALFKRLFEEQDPFTESKKQEVEARAQLAQSKELAPWRALTMAGLGTVQGNPDPALRQNFLSNLGYGAEKGFADYGKSTAEQADINKMLLGQIEKREASKFGRDVALHNALTTSIAQKDAREIGLRNANVTAAATAESRNERLRLQAAALWKDTVHDVATELRDSTKLDPKYRKDPVAFQRMVEDVAKTRVDEKTLEMLGKTPAKPTATPAPGVGSPTTAKVYPPVPAAAISALKSRKDMDVAKKQFDAMFGPGAADKALGK